MKSVAYMHGVGDCAKGFCECPYPSGTLEETEWQDGYDDQRGSEELEFFGLFPDND